MNDFICNIRTFHAGRFTVSVDAFADYDVDLSFDDTGEVLRDLESGKLCAFSVCAKVSLDGNEIASDWLGGCIYRDPAEFEDHRQCAAQNRKFTESGQSCRCGSYFADMVRNVCSEARKEVKRMQSVKVRA